MKKILLFTVIIFSFVPSFARAESLLTRLSGRILLQVESRGEAWYVNPVNEQRYFLGSPDYAWNLMRTLALGISNKDMNRLFPPPYQGGGQGVVEAARLSGRILLAVEDLGKAYYVDPLTMKLFYLGRPADAFNLMRSKGLGITNADLSKIPISTPSTSSIFNTVPFAAQAPFGDWSDQRQQDGCEEASAFMTVKWARGETFTPTEARDTIVGMSDWEKTQFGTFEDTSVADTASRLLKTYLSFTTFTVQQNIGTNDIIAALKNDQIIIVAVNGQKLSNPNFVNGGPLRHMLVVTGYDAATDEFVTNDPGTQFGANYRYSRSTLSAALMDYPSGNHVPVTTLSAAMITVARD